MDKLYMAKALKLAKKAEGFTYLNPMVGAVIVKENRIIGQGYHENYGQAHAEINAIKSASENLEGSTMYVNLEPCFHQGKTPPCVKAILENKIKRLVVACLDPNPLVAGKGVTFLREHGVQVDIGVLEEDAVRLNEVFFKNMSSPYPFLALKSAMTLDGKLATKTSKSKWISGKESREFVHILRHRYKGILVGINTILKDDPSLTTRIDGLLSPSKIVVDTRLRIPLDAKVVRKNPDKLIVAYSDSSNLKKIEYLENLGVKLLRVDSLKDKVDMRKLMIKLQELGINSILVEGGGNINFSLLEAGLVDKLYLFIAPKIFGGPGVSFVSGEGVDQVDESFNLSDYSIKFLGQDLVLEGYFGGNC